MGAVFLSGYASRTSPFWRWTPSPQLKDVNIRPIGKLIRHPVNRNDADLALLKIHTGSPPSRFASSHDRGVRILHDRGGLATPGITHEFETALAGYRVPDIVAQAPIFLSTHLVLLMVCPAT
jgi:hypothetical protein